MGEMAGQDQLGVERSKGGAGGAITLERYATLRAEMDAGVPQPEVLEREKVSEAEWLVAQAFWMKSMADEARRNKFGTTIRYQAIYGAKKKNFENRLERNRAKRERPPIEPPPVAALSDAGAVLQTPLAAAVPARAFPAPPPAPARAPWSPPPPQAPASPVAVAPPGPAAVSAPKPPPLMSFQEEPSFAPQTARDVSPFGAAVAAPARVGAPFPIAEAPAAPAYARPANVEAPVSLPPNTQPPLTQPPATQPDPQPRRHRATVSIDLNSPEAQEARRAAMPFQSPTAAAAAAAPAKDPMSSHPPPTSAFEKRRDLGSTWSSSSAPPSSATMPFQRAAQGVEGKPSAAHAPSAGLPFQRQGGSSPAFPAVVPPAPGQSETTPLDLSADDKRQLRDALALAKPAKQDLGATITTLDNVKAVREATPFQSAPPGRSGPGATAPPSPAYAPTAPAPAPVATQDDDDDDVPRTKMLDPGVVAKAVASATPFGSSPTAGGARESPRTTALDASQLMLGGTPFQAASTPAGGGRPKETPPPFSAVAAPGTASPVPPPPPSTRSSARARFTINVFASLTAEIAENPGEIEAIRARYGISEAEHHEESQRWTEEFQKNEELRARYLGIVQRYRGYVQQRKR